LTAKEQAALHKSAEAVRKLVDSLQTT
jgi:hypothetical protein